MTAALVSVTTLASPVAIPANVGLAHASPPAFARSVAAASAVSAMTIACVSSHGDQASFEPVTAADLAGTKIEKAYAAAVDSALSIGYLGEVVREHESATDRWLTPNKKTTAGTEMISDWDGNSGLELTVPKGVLEQAVNFVRGQKFLAHLNVYQEDTDSDANENDLVCQLVPTAAR